MEAKYTKIDSYTFTAELITQASWGGRELGKHESTMDLYFRTDNTGFIEWDIPELEMGEEIGLTFEFDAKGVRTLCDYDGVFALPKEAIELLRRNGVIVSKEFE